MRSRTLTVIFLVLVALAAFSRSAPATAQAQPEAAPVALTGVRAVAAGYYHGCAVLTNGQVRCWGFNSYGQVGNGDSGNNFTAATVVLNAGGTGPLVGVRTVVTGDDHSCALLTNAQVRCWGDNSFGELGEGSQDESHLPIAVKNAAGTGPLTGVRQISAGGSTTCAVLENGQARCWGRDAYGQLGSGFDDGDRSLPTPVAGVGTALRLTRVTQIDTGFANTCARLSDGTARCWGSDQASQLGNGAATSTERVDRPVVVRNGPDTGPLRGVTSVTTSYTHSCARLADGTARCWGYNLAGKLGDGEDGESATPVVVRNGGDTAPLRGVADIDAGAVHTCARLTDGSARCWGDTQYGQAGNGAVNDDLLLPVPVRNTGNNGNLAGVTQLSADVNHTCARLSDGQARCWGYGEYGGLGNGGATPTGAIPVKVLVAIE
jgi:alpha-tubulin suppressor-like RCC1 family protein